MAVLKFCSFSSICGFKRPLLFAGVFLTLCSCLFAQVPTSTPPLPDDPNGPLRIKTDLVTLTLTVTDLYGRYVSGLTKNAFTVIDNNQEQEITFFSDSDAPVSVGVLFDVSGSMSGEKIVKGKKGFVAVYRYQPSFRRVFSNCV